MPKGASRDNPPEGRACPARAPQTGWPRSRSAIVLALLFAVLGAGAAAQDADGAKLIFLGNKNIAPVVYLEKDRPAGVAVDLTAEIAKHIRQPIEIRAIDWAQAQAMVAAGEADALIQINETDARRKIFDFSDTLLQSRFSIFVSSERVGISDVSSLQGLRVGVEAAGLPRELLQKEPGILLRIIPDFLEGFRRLNAGALDAVVVDYRVGAYVIARNNLGNIRIAGDPIAFSYSSIAVKKGNAELLAQVNEALRTIKRDGSYQKTLEKWEPTEVVFKTREQIAQTTYEVAIAILLGLFLIAILWMVTLSRQLARRKAAEGKLREQHSTLQSIITTSDALIFSVDRQYRYTNFNAEHAAMMKTLYGADIELGRSVLDCMSVPADRAVARRNLDRALAGEQLIDEAFSGEELRSRRYFHVSHRPIRNGTQVIGAAVLAQDISELEQTRAALRRSETSYQSIVAAMAEGVMVEARNGEIVAVNPTAERILGRPAGQLLGHTLEEVVRGAVRADGTPLAVAEFPCRAALRTGDPQSNVIVGLLSPAGARQWISINAQPVRADRADAPSEVVSTFQDITERARRDAIAAARLHLLQVSANESLGELLEETLNQSEQLTGSEIGFYHFIDGDQQSLTLQSWSSNTKARFCQAEGKGLHYPIAQAGVWVDCVRERRGVIHNDYSALPHRKGLPAGHAPVIRLLAVPVIRGDKVAAVLGVGNKTGDYTDKDLETVSSLADLAWDIADRKRADEEERQLNRELRAISNCNQTLMRAHDEQSLLDDICRIVCTEAGYRAAWVGYVEGAHRSVRVISWVGDGRAQLASLDIAAADIEDGREPAADAIRTAATVCVQDLAETIPAVPTEPWRRRAIEGGYRSKIALPLLDPGGSAFGVLCIYSAQSHAFTPQEQRLLQELSADLAFGVSVLRAREQLKRAEQERLEYLDQLERRVAARTAELERANAELQAFSYSVSHDLRAPLAAIDGFSTMLMQKHRARLDEGVRHYLDRIHRNAVRMATLIDDILAFSRVGQREATMAPVDMTRLAAEVFDEVRSAVPQRHIEFTLRELPPARGDRAMVRQVLVNLLSNAVKYTSPREQARIEVGGEAGREGNTYWVKDNGVGFDPQYADKLFGVFQRLHGATEFEGTGIGLAIVKRIVVRHGGQVLAAGKPGEGATLSFTLPPA